MVKMKTQKARNREIERAIFWLVNKERKKRGLGELKLTSYLIHAAREHSKDMIRRGYFSHISHISDTPGFDEGPMERVKWSAEGYAEIQAERAKRDKSLRGRLRRFFMIGAKPEMPTYVGENIDIMPQGVEVKGIGYIKSEWDVAKAMMRIWMKSAGHRENILDSSFTKVGIGVACKKKHGHREYYATQDFQG